jgi:flavin reductase (DIM6/NTAB) family NADH-FMN oxidoreductase RutF
MSFREISPEEFEKSPFRLIGKEWLLITAPDGAKESGANAMTASWGNMGILWNKPVATIFVRPQRYSYSLCESADRFSLSVLPDEYRNALKTCGTKSGKDLDKLAECSLSCTDIDGVKVIEQSRIAMICKKLYADDLKKECFIDKDQIKHYPTDDFHRFYILEIEKILIKD